jgi:integrase
MLARLHRGERVERSSRTVGEVAEAWLERGRGQKGPWDATTRERYERVVRLQVLASADPTCRPLGETKLRDVTPDRVAVWSQGNEQALAPSTAWLALIALNQVFRYAIRRGWMGVNPVAQLEPGEKPRWRVEHVRILEGADLARLLAHARAARVLFEFLAYTGLRIGEALGLRWGDVDFEAGVLHVRQQLSRHRTPKPLKTGAARREVVLAPAVRRLLRARWLASSYKDAEHLEGERAGPERGHDEAAREVYGASVCSWQRRHSATSWAPEGAKIVKIEYDPEADALYIQIREAAIPATTSTSRRGLPWTSTSTVTSWAWGSSTPASG